ncbi:MAG: RNB domain-containing ribonuclease [Actinobacteria bacterium]|nr:RNB domain-containing ribonuclease [Actinomycetota bacterium]
MPRPKRPSRSRRHAGVLPERPGPPRAVAGLVVKRGRHLEIDPLFQPGLPLLPAREGVKPRAGDLVLFVHSHGRRARVTRVIGSKGRLEDVLEALLLDTLGWRGFEAPVLAEAADAARLERRPDPERVDLRDLFTFTVDPATARDFDDALSFRATERGTLVYVHIADVSYYVSEGSEVDREALRRGTSVYVPTSVEPMLPPVLSAGVCSLRPGEERKTVTVEMELDPEARVLGARFYRSLIRSDERLDYDQLEAVFQGKLRASETLAGALALGRPLAQRLRRNRYARGSLRVESTEPDFHWDAAGQVVGAHPAEELESHGFIEEYMILANQQVAGFLEREGVPTVYRVHDQPDPFNVDRLLDLLAGLDVPTPAFDPIYAAPSDVRRAMAEVADIIDGLVLKGRGKAALTQQVLRAQSRAVYQTHNIGHFGLALGTYCHFTSPIRRYPDLLVHRSLLARLGLGPRPTTSTLAEWAEHCSRAEREAARVELKSDDIALAYLLKRRLDEEGWAAVFEAEIMGFVRGGAFVLFDRLHEGFLSARELPGDYYELNDLESALVGRRTGAAFRLADLIRVRVLAIDEVRGRVDVTPADL